MRLSDIYKRMKANSSPDADKFKTLYDALNVLVSRFRASVAVPRLMRSLD